MKKWQLCILKGKTIYFSQPLRSRLLTLHLRLPPCQPCPQRCLFAGILGARSDVQELVPPSGTLAQRNPWAAAVLDERVPEVGSASGTDSAADVAANGKRVNK